MQVGEASDPEKARIDEDAVETRSLVSDLRACYSRVSADEVAFCESQLSVCMLALGSGRNETLKCRGPIARLDCYDSSLGAWEYVEIGLDTSASRASAGTMRKRCRGAHYGLCSGIVVR